LPEVTRSLAEAGVPLATEVNRWIETAGAPAVELGEEQPEQASHEGDAVAPPASLAAAAPIRNVEPARSLSRANHRRLKAPKSMSRRRGRRA
jgi:hypothetical protein